MEMLKIPYKPSEQAKKIKASHDGLFQEFLNTEIKRPKLGASYATCMVCGGRTLLPRTMGNICGRCKKEKEQKVKIDESTLKFLKKNPNLRRRFQY